jgi:signal transduction histidine kinase
MQAEILERIARNAPLQDTLDALVVLVERQLAGAIGALLLVEPAGQRLRYAAGRGLATSFHALADSIDVGPCAASCGTAAFRGEPVFVSDIAHDPLWESHRDAALSYGLRACWSVPIQSRRRHRERVLGTFAIYFRTPRLPEPADREVLASAEALACIALEAHHAARDNEARLMDAIGRLAGGVAHDLNNLLTVINGYSDVLLEQLADGAAERGDLAMIRDAGSRAAALTAQLLAFSRRTIIAPKPLDLNALVERLAPRCERAVGASIQLVTRLAPALAPVMADAVQLEQVVMNLVANARDAMPHGGTLTIATSHQPADRRQVCLAVIDTGDGMTDEVRARAFEPFFTTKPQGQGAGLGLATAYGIVEQAGGELVVDSALGRGSTFRVLLPALDAGELADAPPDRPSRPRGSETVLLAEDEDAVRRLVQRALELHGYSVLPARNGEEAETIERSHGGPIHMLVTDVVMPGMGGRELADTLKSRRPQLKVLYMSGYTNDEVVRHGVIVARDAFLQKPFTPTSLVAMVRATLA